MQKITISQLNQLNIDCYQTAADDFDQTRQTAWAGWQEVARHILPLPERAVVLDIGCGNARWAEFVHQYTPTSDWQYIGYDVTASLLAKAETKLSSLGIQHQLHTVDLIDSWLNLKPVRSFSPNTADLVVAFGFIHHVPSFELRRTFLTHAAESLKPGGQLVVAAWQFTDSPKLVTKQVAGAKLGFPETDLEPNDYFLSWSSDPAQPQYRYCHLVTASEMAELTADLPLNLKTEFKADGQTGQLNHYWVWESQPIS